tara:strand:- start:515 stop:619 length:105 start_codon:yes stop_codon:yes gene_type:complete
MYSSGRHVVEIKPEPMLEEHGQAVSRREATGEEP